MSGLITKLEPGIWALFGAGFFVGSLLYPAWVLVVGIAAPLGWTDGLEAERALRLGGSLIGRVVLLALIVFPLWNAAHHFRHWLIDLGGYERDRVMAWLIYGAADVLTLVALWAVIRIPFPA